MLRGPQDGNRQAGRCGTGDTERCRALATWLHTYNHHRDHTALGGQLARGPGRGSIVVAESFSQSGESLAVRR
jgi:hypothetical protein